MPLPRALEGQNAAFDIRTFFRKRRGDIKAHYHMDGKEFASGGSGQVFLARGQGGRKVIIKRVVLCGETNTKRLQQECSIMQNLDHPNICRLYETYEQGRILFFVLEYCQAGDLFSAIIETEKLSEADTGDIIAQIASALKYAHSMGVAHRDLKPENICLTNRAPSENHVKVIDWGLSAYFGATAERMMSAVGTPTYAAPEVIAAKGVFEYTESCDLWSLGVLTYVMLCGRVPFWGNIVEQLEQMKAEQYPFSEKDIPNVSSDAKDFVRNLLRAKVSDRMSMSQVIEHQWFRRFQAKVDKAVVEEVLFNVTMGSKRSKFLSLCVASAARQMDHSQLKDIAKVFRKLDTESKGSLAISDFLIGFEELYGPNSKQAENIAGMVKNLDIDGSGRIDYTEFCAAALDETVMEQDALLAGFNAFDLEGDGDKVTITDLEKVLTAASCGDTMSPEICKAISQDIVEKFDSKELGYLEFDGWKRMHAGERRKVAWSSLDPRTGDIVLYPKHVAEMLEQGWARREESIYLGSQFHLARVYYKSESGFPFQRTPSGLRDVRRILVDPDRDEFEVGISGVAGEYRFDPYSSDKKTVPGVLMNAIDAQKASQDEDNKVQPVKHKQASISEAFNWLCGNRCAAASLVQRSTSFIV
jgi:calcium-dependent protein kinase